MKQSISVAEIEKLFDISKPTLYKSIGEKTPPDKENLFEALATYVVYKSFKDDIDMALQIISTNKLDIISSLNEKKQDEVRFALHTIENFILNMERRFKKEQD